MLLMFIDRLQDKSVLTKETIELIVKVSGILQATLT